MPRIRTAPVASEQGWRSPILEPEKGRGFPLIQPEQGRGWPKA